MDLIQKKDGLVHSQRLFEILGRTPEKGRALYLEMIQLAQAQIGPVPRQSDFRLNRKQKLLESQLALFLASFGSTTSLDQIQSEQRTTEIVRLRRDFASQAYAQGYTVNEITAALRASPCSVRNRCHTDD